MNLNKFHFLKSVFLSNINALNSPFKCSIAVTYRCNMRCKMCSIWEKAPCEEASAADISKFIEGARDFSWIGLTGGEPFLRSDMLEIADNIASESRRLISMHFATNGFLTDKIISFVESLKILHPGLDLFFTVSIDGPEYLHDDIRGVPGAWKHAIDTLNRLRAIKGVHPRVGFTISNHNAGKFKEMLSSLKSEYPALRFDDINVNIFQQSGFYYDNVEHEGLKTEKVLEQIDEILAMDKEKLSVNNYLRRTYLKHYYKYCDLGHSPLKCRSLDSTVFIDPSGYMYPCAIYERKLADIKKSEINFRKLINTDEIKRARKDCAENRCPGCWNPCDAYSSIAGSLAASFINR